MSLDVSQQLTERLRRPGAERGLHFAGCWRPWSWLADAAGAIDAALVEFGVGRDQPVALVSRNRPAHVAAVTALSATHRTTCMIYSAQSPAAIAAEIERLSAPAVLADAQDWTPETLAAVRAVGALGLAISDDRANPVKVVEAPPAKRASGRKPLTPAIAFELLSSGTTGAPKRFPLSWEALNGVVAGAAAAYAGSDQHEAPLVMLHPLGNVAGVCYLAPALAKGQPIVLLEKFTVEDWTRAVREHRPVRTALPTAAVQMVLDARPPREDLASLNLIAVGGAAISVDLHQAFEEAYGIPILTAYGATEFGGVIANWTLDEYRRLGPAKRGSAGRPSPGASLRILDPETLAEVPVGQVGLLEARVQRIGPDWIRTTDLASLDEDGFLYLHGRTDDAINRGGFKVLPAVVAAALRSHPAVADAAVVGLPDPRLGEAPAAVVELRTGAEPPSPQDLEAFLRERLLAYQVPVRIKIVPTLPRNASMKISLPEVRNLFALIPEE